MPLSDSATGARYGQPKMWVRDNSSGCWTSEQVLPVPPSKDPAAEHSQSIQPKQKQEPPSSGRHTEAEQQAAAGAAATVAGDAVQDELLRQSLVLVEVEIPHVALMDGVHAKSFAGRACISHQLQCWMVTLSAMTSKH